MKQIETSIIINAPQIEVWNALVNFKDYAIWNPFITQISGNLAQGNALEVLINPPNGNPMKFKPIVETYTPTIEFSWIGHLFLRGIFDGNHYFKLNALSKNKTQLIHGERFGGIASSLLLRFIEENTRLGFELMNQSLKNRLEN